MDYKDVASQMDSEADNPTFVIIGAGNVASHLAVELSRVGCVKQVYSRTLAHAADVVAEIGHGEAIDDTAKIDENADYYIISVTDDSVAEIASKMHGVKGIVAHTSGSVPMQALAGASDRIGVFYPLQTFSKGVALDMKEVPFFIEASDQDTKIALFNLARKLGCMVYEANSKQRALLHVAAVFACNFTNHFWTIADEILNSGGYDLSVLYPLLKCTLNKAMSMPPAKAQTGPAVRADMNVIQRHLDVLKGREKDIYRLLTQSIMLRHQTQD